MELDIYQVDAFASKLFEGNPAAVCPLDSWLSYEIMQNIAMENNLSETAFFVDQGESYRLRWFTPRSEVDLCGHATLASAHVLFNHLGYGQEVIVFDSNSGALKVHKEGSFLKMDFPAQEVKPVPLLPNLLDALGIEEGEIFQGEDYMVVVENEEQVRKLTPIIHELEKVDKRGVIVTAPGNETDFVSRFFAPSVGIDEDPVTGSAHTMMAPYWSDRLGKKELKARQLSSRGGELFCKMGAGRVEIAGKAQTYLAGKINI